MASLQNNGVQGEWPESAGGCMKMIFTVCLWLNFNSQFVFYLESTWNFNYLKKAVMELRQREKLGSPWSGSDPYIKITNFANG